MIIQSEELRRRMEGYGITTAKIHYFLPDNPTIISPNPLLWQFDDLWPEFPRLNGYLKWWPQEIQGPIAWVTVMHNRLGSADLRPVDGIFRLN